MLVLTRRQGESIVIAGQVRVEIHRISKGRVRLAIEAPKEVSVDREEIWQQRWNTARWLCSLAD